MNNSIININSNENINLIFFIKKYISDYGLKDNSINNQKFINYKSNSKFNLDKIFNMNKLNNQIKLDLDRSSFEEININNEKYYFNKDMIYLNINSNINFINIQLIDLTNNNLEVITLLKLFMNQFILNTLYGFIANKIGFLNINNSSINCKPIINKDRNKVINIIIKNNNISYNLDCSFYIELIIDSNRYNIGSTDFNINFEINNFNYNNAIIKIKSKTKWFYYDKPIILKFISNFNKINENINKETILNLLLNNLELKDNTYKDIYISLVNLIIKIKGEKDITIFNLIYDYLTSSNNNKIKDNLSLIINDNKKIKNDYLLISYNEKDNKFDNYDSLPLIYKVYNENPLFIIVCTQESGSGNNHFQHIFSENVKKLNYNLLIKEDASVGLLSVKNKNVRTRIYYNSNKIDSSKYIVTNFEKKISKKSGLSKFFEKTFYKGSIFMRLEIKKSEIEHKLIIVNSHLYFNKSSLNTGIKKREEEFLKIVEEFNLIDYWKRGYNIFFCGDLNFRLYSSSNIKENNDFSKISYDIVKTYLENNKQKSTNIIKEKNQLYQFLSELEKNYNNKEFYQGLKNSIDKIGIDLTSKYFKNRAIEEYKFYKNKDLNDYKKIFKIDVKKNKNYPRIPAASDKILFVLDDNIDLDFYFNLMLLPDKSSHKMITLSFNISKKNIII